MKIEKLKIFLFLVSGFWFLVSDSASADLLDQAVLFNINPEYEYLHRSQVGATLRKISDRAYWYMTDDYWSEISESQKNTFLQKLDELALEFDSRIYPVETSFWGSEWNPGIDGDPKITILLARLIDQAGGYFDTSNEYEKSRVPESNQREMVFINAASLLNGRAKVFLTHEFQHLIEFYQKEKLMNAEDDVWLNELRSEYSVKLLGYEDNFSGSNLERRVFAFKQSPSEPLAEWKNLSSDYGAIAVFSDYLTGHYGGKALADSLKSGRTGIDSLNESFSANGISDTFSDVFSNWTVASILNDASINPRFAYNSSGLSNLRVSPDQSYSIFGAATVSISDSVKSWQPVWYEFDTPVNSGGAMNLRIDFSADSGAKFRIPYVVFKINGQKEAGFLPVAGSEGVLFLKNFGSDLYKVILVLSDHSKLSGFTDNDPAVSFNLNARLTEEFKEPPPIQTPEPQSQISIQDLFAQISILQDQISKLRQKAVPFPLNRNLFVTLRGDDVKWLQEFLLKEGVYPEGRITGYFGALTRNAVVKFQRKYGISPQTGYVGPKTRAKIKEL